MLWRAQCGSPILLTCCPILLGLNLHQWYRRADLAPRPVASKEGKRCDAAALDPSPARSRAIDDGLFSCNVFDLQTRPTHRWYLRERERPTCVRGPLASGATMGITKIAS